VKRLLPVGLASQFRGFNGHNHDKLCLYQAFTTLYKIVRGEQEEIKEGDSDKDEQKEKREEACTYKKTAFQLFVIDEIAEVCSVCLHSTTVLEYGIWSINTILDNVIGAASDANDILFTEYTVRYFHVNYTCRFDYACNIV
jgi:hypothetical protein